MAPAMLIAGVMSGTSADAADVALVSLAPRGWKWRLVGFTHRSWSEAMRCRILRAASGEATLPELAALDRDLGRGFGKAVIAACRKARWPLAQLDLIGSHGQTVFHAGRIASVQLGAAAEIAALTGVPVVSDFRRADIAHGGEGAPLAPWLDWLLLRHRTRYRVALNLGGIANLTLLPPGARPEDVRGFDTGPANMLLDLVAARRSRGRLRYDRGGAIARQGTVNQALLRRLLRHPFLKKPPPKSCGREQFGEAFLEALPRLPTTDLMATLTAFTAQSVARGLAWGGEAAMQAEVIVSGGGARNSALMDALRSAAPRCRWRTSDELGLPSAAKEAILMAFLAAAHVREIPASLLRVTGARRPVVLGSFTPLITPPPPDATRR